MTGSSEFRGRHRGRSQDGPVRHCQRVTFGAADPAGTPAEGHAPYAGPAYGAEVGWPAAPAPAGVVLTPVGPEAEAAAALMHARCSAETLERRYPGPPERAAEYLAHLLRPQHGRSVGAWSAEGALVGLGHLLWDGEDAEVALLVEDAWQHRGVGGALLAQLVALARRAGCAELYAVTRASDDGMMRLLRAAGLSLRCARSAGTLVISAALPPGGMSAAGEATGAVSGAPTGP